MRSFGYIILLLVFFTSCVSKKEYLELQSNRDEIQKAYDQFQTDIGLQLNQLQQECDRQIKEYQSNLNDLQRELDKNAIALSYEKNKVNTLQQELEHFKNTNATLLSQYVSGTKKPSPKQTAKILSGIHQIGQELSGINLLQTS